MSARISGPLRATVDSFGHQRVSVICPDAAGKLTTVELWPAIDDTVVVAPRGRFRLDEANVRALLVGALDLLACRGERFGR